MITSYVGVPEPCVNVESVEELYEALDLLHTQVMDNLNEDAALLRILSDAMDRVQAIIDNAAAVSNPDERGSVAADVILNGIALHPGVRAELRRRIEAMFK